MTTRTHVPLWSLVTGALLLVGVALTVITARSADPEPIDRPIQVSAGGYVSSETCRGCHPSQYASWDESYHRAMTQLPTPETVVGDFSGVGVALRERAGCASAVATDTVPRRVL